MFTFEKLIFRLSQVFSGLTFQQQSCNGPSGRLAEAPAQTSVCANNGDLDYMNALGMSIMFYEANMAGELPSWHRIPWRGDSTLRGNLNLLTDTGENGPKCRVNFRLGAESYSSLGRGANSSRHFGPDQKN